MSSILALADDEPPTEQKPGNRVSLQTVLGVVVSVLLAYGAVEGRVRVLETRNELLEQRSREMVEEMKDLRTDIKTLTTILLTISAKVGQ